MSVKTLPQDLTSYDLLKTVALLLMVVDHAGYYLLPDMAELRWVGRMAAPIWLFLIGFARSRSLPWTLFAGAGVLQSVKLLTNVPFWPVDILFTIVLIRLVLDPVMRLMARGRMHMVFVMAVLLVLAVPSYFGVMYGTLGLMFSMFGAMVRQGYARGTLIGFGGVTAFAYAAVAMIAIPFSLLQTQFLMLAVGGLLAGLCFFQPRIYDNCPKGLAFLLKIGGRHSLVFYVVHLILFMTLAAWLKIGAYHFI